MLNVVKFVIHSWRLPAHGLHAIEVIHGVGKSSAMAQSSLLATFRVNENTANTIIKGKIKPFWALKKLEISLNLNGEFMNQFYFFKKIISQI